ncbi:hypothetical protein D9R12_12555 [Pseudoxanthomonas spadix]|nr:hypothetical protein D9R12_12555 [Pseudoxanthomonas spadix]
MPFPARSAGHRCAASANVRRRRFWLLLPSTKVARAAKRHESLCLLEKKQRSGIGQSQNR